jgi:fumarate reductase subunit C
MMGGVLPKTCGASYKYGIINFDKLLHLVGFFCMNCTMMHRSMNINNKNNNNKPTMITTTITSAVIVISLTVPNFS